MGKGVRKIDISLEEQRVNVEADRSYDDDASNN